MVTPAAAAAKPTASAVADLASTVEASTRRTRRPAAASTSSSRAASGVRTRTTEVRATRSASVVWLTRRPRDSTTTSSTVCATSLSRWLDRNTVRPSPASERSRPRSQRIPSGSSPLSGSSKISTPGSPSIAAARLSRCRMPSENRPTARPATSDSPVRASTSSTRRRGSPVAVVMTRKCWAALRPGWKVLLSSAAPTRRTGSGSRWYGRPSMVAVPAVGLARPSRMRRVLVLPDPLGPRNPVTRPGPASKDRSSTARTWP